MPLVTNLATLPYRKKSKYVCGNRDKARRNTLRYILYIVIGAGRRRYEISLVYSTQTGSEIHISSETG